MNTPVPPVAVVAAALNKSVHFVAADQGVACASILPNVRTALVVVAAAVPVPMPTTGDHMWR